MNVHYRLVLCVSTRFCVFIVFIANRRDIDCLKISDVLRAYMCILSSKKVVSLCAGVRAMLIFIHASLTMVTRSTVFLLSEVREIQKCHLVLITNNKIALKR